MRRIPGAPAKPLARLAIWRVWWRVDHVDRRLHRAIRFRDPSALPGAIQFRLWRPKTLPLETPGGESRQPEAWDGHDSGHTADSVSELVMLGAEVPSQAGPAPRWPVNGGTVN